MKHGRILIIVGIIALLVSMLLVMNNACRHTNAAHSPMSPTAQVPA